MARCRWINDPEIGWWHMPECMGTVHDPEGFCCCPDDPNDQSVEARLERIERRLELALTNPNRSPS
jgi:hypothetical protein